MEVIIRPTADEAAELTSKIIKKSILEKPNLVLGLATGGTMEVVYDKLVCAHKEDNLDFSLCRTFNLDEYIGLPVEDKNSYRYYMNKNLFSRINIDIRNTYLPNGMAENYTAESDKYERLIRENGGIDLQLLGIGRSGHIGFNEPLSALQSRTREKALTPVTIEQNEIYFEPPESMPKRAFTMGIGTILDARKIVLLATGEGKAGIIAKAVEGPVTSMISASALQLHPKTTIIVDESAAKNLEEKEYYHWLFENEPEWDEYK